jgi:hypothetical protein
MREFRDDADGGSDGCRRRREGSALKRVLLGTAIAGGMLLVAQECEACDVSVNGMD